MGQNRNDTSIQQAAKRRTAERSQCPVCGRKNALLRQPDKVDGVTVGLAVECRWKARGLCTHAEYTDWTS